MLRKLNLTNYYKISHLYYEPQNEKLLLRYKERQNRNNFGLPLKFIPADKKPTLFNKIFLDKELSKFFTNTVQFITTGLKHSYQQNLKKFSNIEEHFMQKVLMATKIRQQQIILHKCNVGRAYYLQEKKISGVFFHRKLNLARSCYSMEFTPAKQLKYRLKNRLKRAQDLIDISQKEKLYEKGFYSRFYQDTYEGFIKGQTITRALLKIVADVQIQIKRPQIAQPIKLGYEGPTQHILQIQTFKVPYQAQQYMVTDIDFFMQGNYHFLKEKN